MGIKAESLGNFFTAVFFTIVPIILFSTILVLKLRDNYLQEIEHIKTNNKQGHESLDICLKDLGKRVDLHTKLIEDHRLCRTSIAKISETVEGLSDALKSQVSRHFDTRERMTKNEGKLRKSLGDRDNITLKLKAENLLLEARTLELAKLLENATSARAELEARLNETRSEVASLKSNTNRLEGEKMGLEKVLVVKEVVKQSMSTTPSSTSAAVVNAPGSATAASTATTVTTPSAFGNGSFNGSSNLEQTTQATSNIDFKAIDNILKNLDSGLESSNLNVQDQNSSSELLSKDKIKNEG